MDREEEAKATRRYAEIEAFNSKINAFYTESIPKSLIQSYQAILDIKFAQLQDIPVDSGKVDRNCLRGKESKIAVVVHFFYEEMWPMLEQRLGCIPSGVGLFVTCPVEKLEIASKCIVDKFPHARFIASRNIGMDIFPFLSVIPILANEGYEIVFKLQTKKGQNQFGELWRDVMLDSLIGNGDNFFRIADEMLLDETITIAGPGAFYLSAGRQAMQNQDKLQLIADRLEIDSTIFDCDWGFFAGTMFCARVSALLSLSNSFHMSANVHDNDYKLDGNIEHALERFFGLLPKISGGNIGLMYPSVFGFVDSSLIKTSPEDCISRAPNISFVLSLISNIDEQVRCLSEIFDLDFYAKAQPLIHRTRVCKIRHYLLCGLFLDIPPCEQFDLDQYWREFFYRDSGKLFTIPLQNISDALVQFGSICQNITPITGLQRSDHSSLQYWEIIAKSGVFNQGYYEQQIGQKFLNNKEAIEHYLDKGVYRDFFPFDGFIPSQYLELNKDLLISRIEPLSHYCQVGALENCEYRNAPSATHEDAPYLRYLVLNGTLIEWGQLQQKQWTSNCVSIVIPVYNNINMTKDCIRSIFDHKVNLNFEIICVDNGSEKQNSIELEEFCAQFKNIIFVRNQDNFNFALGCNIGFNYSSSEAIIFLNNDTLVEDYWIDKLCERLQSSQDIVAVQPRLLYEDRSIQCVGVVFADKQVIGYPIYQGVQPDEPTYLAHHNKFKAITAACIAVRSVDFARVKGFDCHYINGQEDIDLCLRLCDSAEKYCSVVHDCNIIHLESKTPNRGKYIRQNRQYFAKRWRSSIVSDDKSYYSQDNLAIERWKRDSDDFVRLGIAAHRPILRPRKIQEPQYGWSRAHESSLVSDLLSYEKLHSNMISRLKVSIVMPTKNRSDIIRQAIDSVLIQTHQNFELLVVDDGSDDDSTKQIIDSIADSRIKYFKTKPLGVASARNTGLDAATGDYIAFLDSDNTWDQQYIRYSLLHLCSTGALACFAGLQAFNDDQEVVYYRCNTYDKRALFELNYIDLNTIVHHSSVYARNDLDLRRLVDWDYILTLAAQVDFEPLNLVLTNYYDGVEHKRITKNVARKREEILQLVDYVRSKHQHLMVGEEPQNPPDRVDRSDQTRTPLTRRESRQPVIRIKSPCPNETEQPFWGDHHFAVALVKAFKAIGVDQCYIDNLDHWYSTPADDCDVVIVLRGLSRYKPDPKHLNILWIISHPEKILAAEMKQYDRIYCASNKYADRLKLEHSLNVSPLLQATDPDLFRPRSESSLSSDALLFVGNSRNIYRDSVKYLVENNFDQLRVIGRGWEQFIDASYISMQNIANSQLCKEYQSAHFVFNDHWDTMREYGFISNRIFDVVASGSKLITDYVEGLDSILPKNVVFSYHHIDEIKHYLESPHSWPTPQDLSKAASFIRKNHTFKARARTILSYVFSHPKIVGSTVQNGRMHQKS